MALFLHACLRMGRNRALPTADGIGGTIVLLRRQHARAKMQSPLHDTRFETNSGKKAAPHIPASEGKGVAIYRQNQRKLPQPPAAETEKRPNPPEAAETAKTEKHRWSRPAARSEKRRRPFERRDSVSARKEKSGRADGINYFRRLYTKLLQTGQTSFATTRREALAKGMERIRERRPRRRERLVKGTSGIKSDIIV